MKRMGIVPDWSFHGRRSLGSGPSWPLLGQYAVLNRVLNNMVKAGVVVVAAAGNDGGLLPGAYGMCASLRPSPKPQTLSHKL